MDEDRFDRLRRVFVGGTNRRGVLGLLAGLGVTGSAHLGAGAKRGKGQRPGQQKRNGQGKGQQVTLCHKPGTSAARTLHVAAAAAPAHLAHGDTLGPCGACDAGVCEGGCPPGWIVLANGGCALRCGDEGSFEDCVPLGADCGSCEPIDGGPYVCLIDIQEFVVCDELIPCPAGQICVSGLCRVPCPCIGKGGECFNGTWCCSSHCTIDTGVGVCPDCPEGICT